jgi:hypothetical protein
VAIAYDRRLTGFEMLAWALLKTGKLITVHSQQATPLGLNCTFSWLTSLA